MRDFDDSTLWRISAYERARFEGGSSAFQRLDGNTLLSSTLLSDLGRHDATFESLDVLELVAACMRHHEPALIYLQHEGLVWPVTLFPQPMLYHSPRDISEATSQGLANLSHLGMDPPGVRPPGHYLSERVSREDHYRPLGHLLWQVALHGPRRTLLREIGGTAAYRLLSGRLPQDLAVPGAIGPALERLRRTSAPLRDIANWPGMSLERASRLLNGLYLFSALIVSRSTSAARDEPSDTKSRFGFFRPRR